MTTLAKSLVRKSAVLLATLACFFIQTIPLHATVSTVAYWRMGENDTGTPFFGGILLLTNLTDQTGHFPLSAWGTVAYSTNVSAAASSATESTASAEFIVNGYATNNFVSTATDNFGIECWVNPSALGGGQVIFYLGYFNSPIQARRIPRKVSIASARREAPSPRRSEDDGCLDDGSATPLLS